MAVTPVVRAVFALVLGLGMLGVLEPAQAGRTTESNGELDFLEQWFDVQTADRRALLDHGVVVRALPAQDGHLNVIAVAAVTLSPADFIAQVRATGTVTGSKLATGRLSDPPALADLAGLSLDRGDLDRLRLCRPGACRLNLANHEMSALQVALAAASDESAPEVQLAFRRLVLDRVVRYRSGGLEAVPEYNDQPQPARPAAIFSDLLHASHYLSKHTPVVAAYLERPPQRETNGVESFLYWSKAIVNKKAVVMVTHVSIFPPDTRPGAPAVLVVGKQVFASRYMNGELALTMLFSGAGGSRSYLVHIVRSHLDTLGGPFKGLRRALIEGGITDEAARALSAWRDRVEGRP